MKLFKKLLAMGLCAALVLSMVGCHKKNETALTIDGVKITSALYLSALFECDTEARTKVDESKKSSSSSSSAAATSSETDYLAEKIDGQDYADYVKAQALQRCKEYAFYQKMIDGGKLKLTDEEISQANSTADYYWSYYSSYYEPNGVSKETYKKALLYSYYSNAYFKSIYGAGGEKEVDSATISKTLDEKYVLADVLTKTYEDGATDSTKAALKKTFEGYVTRLKKGEAFKKIYEEVNGAVTADASEGTEKPQDSLAQTLGASDTSNASEDFDTVKAMKLGEVKLIENTSGLTIYVRKDILADKYYLNTMTDSVLYLLKQEEFEKTVKEKTANLKVEENGFAMGQLKVKNLEYPSQQQGTTDAAATTTTEQ